ncbi:MAG: hypothetical protein KF893_18925 [Caldilineaceae bacterium]|nr:hypothetical protein [Caldilineaceae bacterium]
MQFSASSTIRDLLADERAKAIVEKHLPGASKHPDLPQAMYMSLREVSYYPESGLTPAKLKEIDEELKQIE